MTTDSDINSESNHDETLPQSARAARPFDEAALEVLLVSSDGQANALALTGEDCVFGRSSECTVLLDDPAASRRHAVLRSIGGALTVTDLGSANGTWCMDARLKPNEPRALSLGESVRMGGTVMIVQRAAKGLRPSQAPRHSPAPAPRAEKPTVAHPPAQPLVKRDDQPRGQWVSAEGALTKMRPLLQRVATSRMNVLILGETGAGKEIFAQTIHRLSPRANGPLISFNCAALSEQLLESELFGHERGAFTGATQAKQGLLESARGGSVFLDEVGEMPPLLQAKMLRVLEQREVMRVGSTKPTPIDVRFVCATNRDLEEEVLNGTFRQDLYFRLNGISIVVPPLRERVGEIAFLAETFIDELSTREKLPVPQLHPAALAQLQSYSWPGNIRELRNVVERAVVVSGGGAIMAIDLPEERMAPGMANPSAVRSPRPMDRPLERAAPRAPGTPSTFPRASRETMRIPAVSADGPTGEYPAVGMEAPVSAAASWDAERARIVAALEQCGGNQTYAAKMLGMARSTFVMRLEMFDIARPRKR